MFNEPYYMNPSYRFITLRYVKLIYSIPRSKFSLNNSEAPYLLNVLFTSQSAPPTPSKLFASSNDDSQTLYSIKSNSFHKHLARIDLRQFLNKKLKNVPDYVGNILRTPSLTQLFKVAQLLESRS